MAILRVGTHILARAITITTAMSWTTGRMMMTRFSDNEGDGDDDDDNEDDGDGDDYNEDDGDGDNDNENDNDNDYGHSRDLYDDESPGPEREHREKGNEMRRKEGKGQEPVLFRTRGRLFIQRHCTPMRKG